MSIYEDAFAEMHDLLKETINAMLYTQNVE